MQILETITTTLTTSLLAILFSPVLLIEPVLRFLTSPYFVFFPESNQNYLDTGANIVSLVSIALIGYLIFTKNYIYILPLVLVALAINCLAALLPKYVGLPYEASNQGFTIFYIYLALYLFIAAVVIILTHIKK
jgi:hypothetical protein